MKIKFKCHYVIALKDFVVLDAWEWDGILKESFKIQDPGFWYDSIITLSGAETGDEYKYFMYMNLDKAQLELKWQRLYREALEIVRDKKINQILNEDKV